MAKIEDILSKFESFTDKPVNYLTVQSGVKDGLKNLVKSVYDYTKSEERHDKKLKKSALSELLVQDFDEEQVWQQIELQNTECWDQLVWEVANCMSTKQDLVFPVNTQSEEEIDEDESSENEDAEMSDDTETPHEKLKGNKKKKNTVKKNTKTSVVDDKFFKLQEMEKFLIDEEKKDGKEFKRVEADSDEESIDMFEDIDDEDSENEKGSKDMMYSDFFDGPNDHGDDEHFDEVHEDINDIGNGDYNQESGEDDQSIDYDMESKDKSNKKKKVKFADESSDDESDNSSEDEKSMVNGKVNKDEKKSDFELRQHRLQQQISRLEEKQLTDAPWQLKGEVDASKRPQNSLLQEVVDFDLTSRPPPVITEQTTVTLEDIIKRRVKDKAWDDVVRKEKPIDDQLSFRKNEIIDQSKSKLSLAQVYEAEYLKQKQKMSGEVEDEKEPESHTQIKEAMNKLFSKLDALCHYHYTPKAPQAEVKIISNTPAISMEEVAPVATSDAALLAPEEVKRKRRGELISKEERTQTDKNRERRKKKKIQRKKGPVEKVTDNRNTKKAVESSDKSLKTSKAFFQQLNDDSTSVIKHKKNLKNKGQ